MTYSSAILYFLQGYIKDYEGATLMGCELNSKIVYTEFSAVVRKQKEILKKLIEQKQAQVCSRLFSGIINKDVAEI